MVAANKVCCRSPQQSCCCLHFFDCRGSRKRLLEACGGNCYILHSAFFISQCLYQHIRRLTLSLLIRRVLTIITLTYKIASHLRLQWRVNVSDCGAQRMVAAVARGAGHIAHLTACKMEGSLNDLQDYTMFWLDERSPLRLFICYRYMQSSSMVSEKEAISRTSHFKPKPIA